MMYDREYMYTVVGLGNPGSEYKETRHNAGQFVLNLILRDWSFREMVGSAKLSGQISEGVIQEVPVRIFFPDTYMNHSGRAVKKVVSGEEVRHLVVVYDDIDLPFGEFKLSFGRGAGGHNGLTSVMKELDTADFLRVRVGIAQKSFFGNIIRPKGEKLADYVLGVLSKKEQSKLTEIAPKIAEALECVFKDGHERAMNIFN